MDLIRPRQARLAATHVSSVSNDFVVATGNWVFENRFQASSIPTSEIWCLKDSMKCQDVNVQITPDNELFVFNDYYKITKWTADELLAEDNGLGCVSSTLTINFRKEEALLFRQDKGGEDCAGIAEKPQILHLEDGFEGRTKYYENKDQETPSAYDPEYSKYLKRFDDQGTEVHKRK